MDSVIGIDLSGLSRGTKGRTAMAQLSVTDPPQLLDLHLLRRGERTDVELLAWVDERKPWVVAIDAPLSLPHAVTCRDSACPRCEPARATYLARDIDAPAGGMPTVMLVGIAFRGIYLARQLRELGYEVIEVYPAVTPIPPGATWPPYLERAEDRSASYGTGLGQSMVEINAYCLWLGYWYQAQESGDAASVGAAVSALDQARSWESFTDPLTSDQGFRDNIQSRIDAAERGDAETVLFELETNC